MPHSEPSRRAGDALPGEPFGSYPTRMGRNLPWCSALRTSWHAPDALTTRRVRSAVALAVSAALAEAGIEVPFPQRIVHLLAERTGSEARAHMVDARERFADARGPVSRSADH